MHSMFSNDSIRFPSYAVPLCSIVLLPHPEVLGSPLSGDDFDAGHDVVDDGVVHLLHQHALLVCRLVDREKVHQELHRAALEGEGGKSRSASRDSLNGRAG